MILLTHTDVIYQIFPNTKLHSLRETGPKAGANNDILSIMVVGLNIFIAPMNHFVIGYNIVQLRYSSPFNDITATGIKHIK